MTTLPCTLDSVGAAVEEGLQWVCLSKLLVVQRCSLRTLGAPAASNPHSCSPGPEPLQSPTVPPASGTTARGACSTNNNNIQHAGPGSKRDPPHHSTRTWTGARTQSHAAAWESRGGGLWVAGAFRFHFTSCLVPPSPPFWRWRRVCREGHYAGGRDRSYICVDYIWKLVGRHGGSGGIMCRW